MKICAAQLKPRAGDFEYNLHKHIELVEKAIDQGIDLVLFPELSLTSYEPSLAKALSTLAQNPRLNTLQAMSIEQIVMQAAP
jgi:predicted amidohydrolase